MSGVMAAVQIGGMFNSAVGSYNAAAGQRQAIQAGAQLDRINANSSALALTGQADLELVNAQANYNATLAQADFGELQAKHDAYALKTSAAISAVRAGSQAAELEAGAQMDEMSAQLSELQALSIMQRGEQKEQDSRMQFAAAKSKATASMAARGLDLGQGAPLAVRAGHDLMSENTAIRIQQAVLMDAFGQRTQASAARVGAASKRSRAALTESMAGLETGLAAVNADYATTMAGAQSTAMKALAAAGMLNANASATYKTTMAGVMRDNAMAAALVKQTMGDGINPGMAAFSSLLTGAGQVAQSWYMYSKQSTGKV